MDQWMWDALVAFGSGVASWLLVSFFDWLPTRWRYRESLAEVKGWLRKANEADTSYDVDEDKAVEDMLKSRAIRKAKIGSSLWATSMQALLTLMIIAPALFWFRDAGRASWAMKGFVGVFLFIFMLTIYHELVWKEEPPTRGRVASVTLLWLVSLGSILLLAYASADPTNDAKHGDPGRSEQAHAADTSKGSPPVRDAGEAPATRHRTSGSP